MPKILVVDDDQQVRVWLRQILEDKKYQVEEAGDGNKALVSIEHNPPDLVVLDIYMSGEDGLELIMRLRSRVPPLKILAISGNQIPGYDTCQTAKVLGAHDALSKPFDAETFLNHVEALLSHR